MLRPGPISLNPSKPEFAAREKLQGAVRSVLTMGRFKQLLASKDGGEPVEEADDAKLPGGDCASEAKLPAAAAPGAPPPRRWWWPGGSSSRLPL